MIGRTFSFPSSVVFNGNDHHHPIDGWPMMGGWWMWLMILIAVILVVILVYLIIVEDKKDGKTTSDSKSPEKILDERYASGETSKEEYKEMKNEIRK